MPDVFAAIDATWPAAAVRQIGPWTLRDGGGGGSRVSAATLERGESARDADIAIAEQDMLARRQTPLFMIRDGQDDLDTALADQGYRVKDPTIFYSAAVSDLLGDVPAVTVFTVWPPLQAQADIWADGGIGAARVAVMTRAASPKTSLLGRLDDTPAATLFAATAGDCAMIHAVEVAERFRGRGLGRIMTHAAARWAQDHGATTLTLVTTRANVAANALYTSLGMAVVGQYHYRIKA